MVVDEEDVKSDISSCPAGDTISLSPPPPLLDFSPPLPPPTTAATISQREQGVAADAQKTEARALCEVVSEEFTVWGGKGCVNGRKIC